MTTDNKTLADAQPGGRVRLGDQALRVFSAGRWNYDGTGQSFSHEEMDAAAFVVYRDVDLAAQPSPGGQGEARERDGWRKMQKAAASQTRKDGVGACDALYELAVKHGASDAKAAGFAHHINGALALLETQAHDGLHRESAMDAALAARQPVGEQHADDLAVDAFAAAMKAKMAAARAKGRGGWEDPVLCTADDLTRMLRDHVEKGDPRDVANFCMMLHQRGESISARLPVGDPVAIPEGWALVDLAEYTVLPQIPTTAMMDAGWPIGEQITDQFDVKGAYADLIAEHEAKGEGIIHGPIQVPAQAVDLGAVRALLQRRIEQWRSHLPADPGAPGTREIETKGEHDYNNDVRIYRDGIAVMDEVLALIDSQAVGNG